MSSRNARKRGKHVGFAMLAMVSLAIFAAQMQPAMEPTAPSAASTGLPIVEVVDRTRLVSERAGPALKPELVEVATNEPQHARLASESDNTDRRGWRDPF